MTMQFIASATPTSGGVNFQNIPQTFTHLQIRAFWRSTFAAVADGFIVRLNANTTNHTFHWLQGDGSSATSGNTLNGNAFRFTHAPGANATSGVFGIAIIDLLDYTNTNKLKTMRGLAGFDNNGSGQVALESGLYYVNTNAIDQITLFPNNSNDFVTGTRIDLYGITTSAVTGA